MKSIAVYIPIIQKLLLCGDKIKL